MAARLGAILETSAPNWINNHRYGWNGMRLGCVG